MSISPADRLAALERFVAADASDSFARYALAMEYRAQGSMDRAITQLEELRSRDSTYLPLYYQLGEMYAGENRRDEARHVYTAGIAIARQANETHTLEELEEAAEALGK